MKTQRHAGENVLTPTKSGTTTADNGDGSDTRQRRGRQGEAEARGPVIDISVLDSVRAFQREGTPDLVDKLVTHYLEDAAETIKALGAAVEDKNTRDTFRLAHKLKSNSAYVGAVHLSSLLTDLGALARQNEVKGAMGLFMAIEQEFESVERALAAQVRTRIASR